MKYISVVPSVRTPFGVDVFDYAVRDDADVQPGDLIMIQFRKKSLPALIVSVQPTSSFKGKTIELHPIQTIVRFLPVIVCLLEDASQHSFASRPSILHSWLRRIPARLGDQIVVSPPLDDNKKDRSDLSSYTLSSPSKIINIIQSEREDPYQGRTLIVTPWQSRAEAIAKYLHAPALHAGVPYALAWKNWIGWLHATNEIDSADSTSQTSRILVTTRVGAWLSHSADRIFVDEPENDDHKEDEQEPRMDARWIVNRARDLHPSTSIIQIGTTPPLSRVSTNSIHWESVPTIDPTITYDHKQRGGYSEIPRLSNHAIQRILEKTHANQPVLILDPYRDTEFLAQLHSNSARELLGSSTIPVLNLSDLHQSGLPKNALVVLLDLAGIGGVIEDIRKKERSVIAWRRLCSRLALFDCQLLVQGDDTQLAEARTWLTREGLQITWENELSSRHTFKYPPSFPRIKLIIVGEKITATTILDDLENHLPPDWSAEGIHEVQTTSSRSLRWIIHVVSKNADQDVSEIHDILLKYAKTCIIDLDPIAFFR